MEYIYKAIEYINESNILNIGLMIFIISYLIYLYTKKTDEENHLGIKLIGFYLLGGFTFNFGDFPKMIPVGFIIFLSFMKNKGRLNQRIKNKASIFAFIILCLSGLNSVIYNMVEYRVREIPMENISINSLKNDYETIKKELGIEDLPGVDSLNIQYNDNNKVIKLDYTIRDYNNKTYYISANKDSYEISISKTNDNDIFMYNTMFYNMNIETLLDVISNTEFKKYENSSYYYVKYENEEEYYENEKNLYTVSFEDYSIEKLNSKYPIYNAVDLSHTSMEKVSENSYESTKTDIYLMEYQIDDELE